MAFLVLYQPVGTTDLLVLHMNGTPVFFHKITDIPDELLEDLKEEKPLIVQSVYKE